MMFLSIVVEFDTFECLLTSLDSIGEFLLLVHKLTLYSLVVGYLHSLVVGVAFEGVLLNISSER